MSSRHPKAILGLLVLTILIATILWGVLTYWLDRLNLAPSQSRQPDAGAASSSGKWAGLVILAVGLLAGWVSGKFLVRGQQWPGVIWTTLLTGVGGAWIGSVLPWLAPWTWHGVNVLGAIGLAFLLSWVAGELSSHRRGRKGGGR